MVQTYPAVRAPSARLCELCERIWWPKLMKRLQRVLDSLVHDWLDNGGVQLLRGRAQGLRHSRNPRLLLTDNVGGTHGELRIKCALHKSFFINTRATEQAALCGKWQLWEGLGGARLSHALQKGKDLSSN